MGLDLVIVLLLAAGFLLGFFRGAVRQLTSIGAWLVSFLLAANLAEPAGRYLASEAPTYTPEYATFLSFGGVFVLLLTAGALLFQVAGTSVSLVRHELLDNLLSGVLGSLLVLLIVTSLIVILDSYFTRTDVPNTSEFQVLREVYGLTLDSAISNVLRGTLIPLLGTVMSPLLPDHVAAVMD